MDTHCQIGRVRLRTGAEIRVIERGRQRPSQAAQHAINLREFADKIAAEWPKIAGFAIVAWDSDGDWTTGYGVSRDSPFGAVAMPRFVADCLRQDVTANAAVECMNNQR